ncbi:MAG: nitroreductase [Desulfobacterales bacterium]|nr:nitroreductase [Desulfobacterales bacterium]MCP4159639.1 nitroreductase [Deltaproteobacteria bacterium]
MKLEEAILKRKSIRKFLDKTVKKETIEKILTLAVRAPSAENTQPWEFSVVTGDVLDKIREENIKKVRNFELPPKEMERMLVERPKESIYRKRQIEIAVQLFKLMGIERDNLEKRANWLERGFRFFDAPAAIIISSDNYLIEAGTFFDVGLLTQTICLAALKEGLHTCIENQGVTYSDVLREHLNIPESKRLVVAMAIGYPDWDFPANKVESHREPVENITKWYGF